MSRIILTLCLPLLALVATSAQAASYFVKPLAAPGVSADDASTINELIRTAVTNDGSTLAKDEKSADAVLESKILHLGSAYILTITKSKNSVAGFSEQARAQTIEDMDTVAARVVRAVIHEKSFSKDTHVSDVTQDEETRGTRRTDVLRQWIFGLGPAWGGNLNTHGTGVGWTIGYSWGIDSTTAIRGEFDFGNPGTNSASYVDFNLGVDYFLSDLRNAPFLTAEFGYGSTAADDPNSLLATKDTSGFALGAGGGMRFFRTSRVNLGLTLKYVAYLSSNSKGSPGVTSMILGVYF